MSRKVKISNLYIGGGEKIAVQSMTTCRLKDQKASILAVKALEDVGCDIVRFSVLDETDARAIKEIKKEIKIPLVADIHFDYKLAIESIKNGADKIRINPGNIGGEENVKKVAEYLKEYSIPVRVGSNTGSIEKEFLSKFGKSEISLGESALKNVALLEKYGVEDIVISVKASDVKLSVKAYEYVAKRCDYPLHLGITEAGTEYGGTIKSAIGIGSLLLKGIGDTIRVSLSADPVKEVIAGKEILSSLDLLKDAPKLVACPTCGRCAWDCMEFAKATEEFLRKINKPLKIAVMGCAVNGPGEAKDSDLGIAGAGNGDVVIFKKGEIIKKVNQTVAREIFFEEIKKCIQ